MRIRQEGRSAPGDRAGPASRPLPRPLMFGVFGRYTPEGLLALVGLLLLLRGALMALAPLPIVVPEINWWLVGEALLEGRVLYGDIWTDTPPLSAAVFAGLSLISPRSPVVSLVAGSVLLLLQALLINRLCLRNALFEERSYVPAAMYILVGHLGYDFLFISPPMLATTGVLMSLSLMMGHVRLGLEEDKIYLTGFLLGMAGLCYLPALALLAVPVIAYAFYTGTPARWYAVLMIGAAFPLLVTGILFYFLGHLEGLVDQFLTAPVRLSRVSYGQSGLTSGLLLAPALLVGWMIARVLTHRAYINYHLVANFLMLCSLLAGIGCYFLSTWRQPACLWMALPGVAYFMARWYYLVSRALLRELVLASLLVYVGLAVYLPFLPLPYLRSQYLAQNLTYTPESAGGGLSGPGRLSGRRLLVFGQDPTPYLRNRLATPYLDRRLAAAHLEDTLHYRPRYEVYRSFAADWPELIIDQDSTVPGLFARLPILARHYEPAGAEPGLYRRREQPTLTAPDTP